MFDGRLHVSCKRRHGERNMTRTLAIALSTIAALCGNTSAQQEFDQTGARPIDAAPQVHLEKRSDKVKGSSSGEGASALAGASWAALGPFGGDVFDVARSPVSPNIMLAGIAPGGSSGGALFRSTDGGANWTIVTGQTTTSVYDIEFAPD